MDLVFDLDYSAIPITVISIKFIIITMKVDLNKNEIQNFCFHCSSKSKSLLLISRLCSDRLCNDCFTEIFKKDNQTIKCVCGLNSSKKDYFTRPYYEILAEMELKFRNKVYDNYFKVLEDFENTSDFNLYLTETEELVFDLMNSELRAQTENILENKKSNKYNNRNKIQRDSETAYITLLCELGNPLVCYKSKEDLESFRKAQLNKETKEHPQTGSIKPVTFTAAIKLPQYIPEAAKKGKRNEILEKRAGGFTGKFLNQYNLNFATQGLI